MSRHGRGLWVGLVTISVLALVVGSLIYLSQRTNDISGCVVVDKDRTKNMAEGSDSRVYTEGCGTLTVGDDLLSWHFSSADTYAQIKVGQTYDFRVRGTRIPILSAFPKIIEIKES